MTTEYITAVSLEPYFVDKDTGVPLAGGIVQFWEDADRTVPKLVYEKQNIGADPVTGQPVYQFVPLPNPLILSGVGTFQDAGGNNIAVYYYPYDADGNLQLYYVAVFNSLGVPQFTREGWPGSTGNNGPIGSGSGAYANCILDPQFASIDFNPSTGLTQSYSGSGTLNIQVAPFWTLQAIHSGSGSITINRISVAGSSNYLTNPPYILQIEPGTNLSSLALVQKLNNNPGIWSPQLAGVNGYVASYILLGPNTSATIVYDPNIGPSTTLLMANNLSSTYMGYANTVQLPPSTNTDTSDTGFVDISIELSTTTTSLLSSIQVLGLDGDVQDIDYVQTPVNFEEQKFSAFESVNIQSITGTGTYTPSTNMRYCVIEILGGGGGGGGAQSTSSSQHSSGSGGGGGEYARGVFTAAQIGASQAVTIGAGGAGGVGATGSNGGVSSVGSLITANGGSGGITVPSTGSPTFAQGGAGGTGGTGGTLRVPGQNGFWTISNFSGGDNTAGPGANSQYGAGGVVGNAVNGSAGGGYGAGGGGVSNPQSMSALNGGAGTSGLVLITEYISAT